MHLIDTPGYSEDNLKEWYELVKAEVVNRVAAPDQFEASYRQQVELNKKKLEGHYDSDSFTVADEMVLSAQQVHLTLFLFDKPELTSQEGAYLKRLSKYVNMIPIFTKGDYIAADEIPPSKLRLMISSKGYGIEWFNCKEVRAADGRR